MKTLSERSAKFHYWRWRWIAIASLPLVASRLLAAPSSDLYAAVVGLGLEDLLKVRVTTVSRKPEPLSTSPAAIHVITGEDIRRSGATSIADALRLAPGLHVARVNSHTWAITSRGLTAQSADKLLVMIDGRVLYNPLFAGVLWDVQDTFLPDIDRIEVIRGPGGTLWGPNAVNGVINIITKDAAETSGILAEVGGGTEERVFGGVRSGTSVGNRGAVRVYAKSFHRDEFPLEDRRRLDEDWHLGTGGFRYDAAGEAERHFTLQGDGYAGEAGETSNITFPGPPFSQSSTRNSILSGLNLLSRYAFSTSGGSRMSVQLYYDRTRRIVHRFFDETRDTGDLEFQHDRRFGRHGLLWGTRLRVSSDEIADNFSLSFDPRTKTTSISELFIQDEITLTPKFRFTGGSRFSYSELSKWSIHPSVRASWMPSTHTTWWAAVSRAERSSTRFDEDQRFNAIVAPTTPAGVVAVVGNEDFRPEVLTAYELGYRAQASRTALDVATFFNDYKRLRSFQSGGFFIESNPPPVHIVVPLVVSNGLEGESYGLEISPQWQATERWRLQAAYTYFYLDLRRRDASGLPIHVNAERSDPENQAYIRSLMNLTSRVELDMMIRYVDRLFNLDVPGYTAAEVRIGVKATERLSMDVVGQNLLDSDHLEYAEGGRLVQHSVYGKISWRM